MVSVPEVLPSTAFTNEPSFASRMVTVLDWASTLGVKLTTIELGVTRETDGAAGVAKVWVTVMTGDLARVVSVPPRLTSQSLSTSRRRRWWTQSHPALGRLGAVINGEGGAGGERHAEHDDGLTVDRDRTSARRRVASGRTRR